MTIPSRGSSVISYDRFIIVVGGKGEDGKYLARVQVLDTTNRQWYQTTPLPEPCVHLTSCVIGNMVYLLGGWIRDVWTPNEHVFSVSLDKLISNAVSPSTGATPSPWSTLEDLPVKLSTALALQGSLLAVGGWGVQPFVPTNLAPRAGSRLVTYQENNGQVWLCHSSQWRVVSSWRTIQGERKNSLFLLIEWILPLLNFFETYSPFSYVIAH